MGGRSAGSPKTALSCRMQATILVGTNMVRAPSNETDVAEVAETMKVLSVETRLRILLLLRDRRLCVGALARRLGITQGAVSQHLRVLRGAGLVKARREGYYVHYAVNEAELALCRDQVVGWIDQIRRGPAAGQAAGADASKLCNRKTAASRAGGRTRARKPASGCRRTSAGATDPAAVIPVTQTRRLIGS